MWLSATEELSTLVAGSVLKSSCNKCIIPVQPRQYGTSCRYAGFFCSSLPRLLPMTAAIPELFFLERKLRDIFPDIFNPIKYLKSKCAIIKLNSYLYFLNAYTITQI